MFNEFLNKPYFKASLTIPLLLLLCIGYTAADTRPVDRNAYTVYYNNKPPNKDGEYQYDFQTSNGITTKGAGNTHGSTGVIQYVSPEGLPITWTYVADSDGYRPEGEHIPMIPGYVTKALDYIRTHPMIDEKKSRQLRSL